MIQLYSFDLALMSWSVAPISVQFILEKDPVGSGGFCKAFKATTMSKDLGTAVWVVKEYLEDAAVAIARSNQTIEQHTKKVVQMHMLARNFAQRLDHDLRKEDNIDLYGETFHYNKVFLVKREDGEIVTVEEFVGSEFTKYINNNGLLCGSVTETRSKAENLAHYSYERSNKELMVLDMQCCGYSLFDPEIASKELRGDDEELLFST